MMDGKIDYLAMISHARKPEVIATLIRAFGLRIVGSCTWLDTPEKRQQMASDYESAAKSVEQAKTRSDIKAILKHYGFYS